LGVVMGLSVKLFTIPLNIGTGIFEDTAVRRFLADKQLVEVRDHFFEHDDLPHLVLIVIYRTELVGAEQGAIDNASSGKKLQIDKLSETDRNLFNTFREWRNERAKQEGIPVFLIASNVMLLEVVSRKPHSLPQIREIKGFGEGKVKKFGPEILSILSSSEDKS